MQINFLSHKDAKKNVQLVLLGFFEGAKPSKEVTDMMPEVAASLKHAISKGRFSGKSGEIFSSYSHAYKGTSEVVFLGLGKEKDYTAPVFRKTAGRIFKLIKDTKVKTVQTCLKSLSGKKVPLDEAAGILQEIAILSAYRFDRYKSDKVKDTNVIFEVGIENARDLQKAKKKALWHEKVALGTLFARTLINEPGNIMNPPQLVKEALKMAKSKKLTTQVLHKKDLERLKMNGILAVNQGSPTPPAMIILEHGRKHKSKGTVCLVGKGVTFDTGGISIKPSRDMEKMKYDMSGAAAVIGAMSAIADLNLPVHVVGITPTVENNVAEDPQRPGDIIKMYNGKTVEVLNTDAEGRLILADALSYSAKYKPKAIIDLATLTGMVVYTFGDKAIGMMGNNDKLLSKVKQAGEQSGERCWELPMFPEYSEQLKGHHSDLYNIGGPHGGTITAAKFLEEFVPEGTPWVHLDIAGVAWCNAERYDCPRGGTGAGVKLLLQFLS